MRNVTAATSPASPVSGWSPTSGARAASCSGGARTRRSPPSGRTPAPRNSKRVFADHGVLRPLRLVERETASTGAILATYARDPA
jgi:hypothetical protein